MGILDLLFPKYCVSCKKVGSFLCANCFVYLSFDTYGQCIVCNKPCVDWLTHPACQGKHTIDGVVTGIRYTGVARKLLYAFKYKPYVASLSQLLGELFYEALIQNEQFHRIYRKNPILVPIPLHAVKLRRRGYNHATILAMELGKKLNLKVVHQLLRTKATVSQVGLDRKKRRENISGVFTSSSVVSLPQTPVVLVDDILTSGATLLEAARVLKKAGVKQVFGVALAQD